MMYAKFDVGSPPHNQKPHFPTSSKSFTIRALVFRSFEGIPAPVPKNVVAHMPPHFYFYIALLYPIASNKKPLVTSFVQRFHNYFGSHDTSAAWKS